MVDLLTEVLVSLRRELLGTRAVAIQAVSYGFRLLGSLMKPKVPVIISFSLDLASLPFPVPLRCSLVPRTSRRL